MRFTPNVQAQESSLNSLNLQMNQIHNHLVAVSCPDQKLLTCPHVRWPDVASPKGNLKCTIRPHLMPLSHEVKHAHVHQYH